MGWWRVNILHFYTNVCWAQTRRWWWISKAELPSPICCSLTQEAAHSSKFAASSVGLIRTCWAESRRWFKQLKAKLPSSLLLFADWKLDHPNFFGVINLVEYGGGGGQTYSAFIPTIKLACWAQSRCWLRIFKAKFSFPKFVVRWLKKQRIENLRSFVCFVRTCWAESRRWFKQCKAKLPSSSLLFAD